MALKDLEDTDLWKRVRNDDADAYKALYLRYVNLVYTEINKRIQQPGEAEDLTQNIFLTLWEKRKQIQLESRFFSYLYRMTQNSVLNYFRDKKIPTTYLETWERSGEAMPHLIEDPVVFNKAQLIALEIQMETERQKLPPKMRRIYDLRYKQWMTPEEISEHLVISENTVRNHLKEVQKRFRAALKKVSFLLLSLF